MKQFCAISCPIDTYSGYGARSRDLFKALYELKKDEYEFLVLSQRWGQTPWGYLEDNKEEWGWMIPLIMKGPLTKQPDVWFQVTIPNEFQAVGKVNIGVTAGIETTICDPSWIDGCNRMNVTLVSSNHAKQVFENTSYTKNDQPHIQVRLERPVEVLFEGVDLNKYFYIKENELPATELVEDLNTIKEEFCFLYVGHWLQGDLGEDRKNTGKMLQVFFETFKNKKKKPALIMKTSNATNCIMDRDEILKKINAIRNTVTGSDLPNVYLLHGDLDDEDINNLYNHGKVKAFVSLTKGEGYGRPLAEFCLSKKPLITSAWSGHMDFLHPEYTILLPGTLTPCHPSAHSEGLIIEGASWFSVDNGATVKALTDVYENYNKYEAAAKRQGHKIKTEFNYDNMVLLLNNYLEKYVTIQAVPVLVLPKLKKLS